MVVLFLIPALVLAFVAVAPAWPYSKNWGYYPSGGLGAILVLTIVAFIPEPYLKAYRVPWPRA